MTSIFTKSAANDFPIGPGCFPELLQEQLNAAISGKTSTVTKNGDVVTITWNIGLSAPEIMTQDGVIALHDTKIPWQVATLTNVNSTADSVFSAYNTAGGIVVGTSWVDLTWDVQDRVDSDYTHTLSTAAITINTTADYTIRSDITIYQTGGNSRSQSEVRLVNNGVFMPGTKGLLYHRLISQGGDCATVEITRTLSAGDVIRVQAIRQSGSGTLETYPDGCRVSIRKLNN